MKNGKNPCLAARYITDCGQNRRAWKASGAMEWRRGHLAREGQDIFIWHGIWWAPERRVALKEGNLKDSVHAPPLLSFCVGKPWILHNFIEFLIFCIGNLRILCIISWNSSYFAEEIFEFYRISKASLYFVLEILEFYIPSLNSFYFV